MKKPVVEGGTGRRGLLGLAGAGAAALAVRAAAAAEHGPPRRPAPGPASGGVFDVLRFGAVADGRTLSTEALQKAIEACAAAGGGTVRLPPGRFLSGALFLRSHVELHLAAGSTLVASERPEDFPPIKGRNEGIEQTVHSSLVTGMDLEGVALTGEGALDGRGRAWWNAYQITWQMRIKANLPREAESPPDAPLRWPRPRLVNLIRCRDVLIEGLELDDSPYYNLHLVYCENVMMRRVTSRRRLEEHNTNVVLDSSQRIRIDNCAITGGGDAIGIKSGYNEDGRRVAIRAEDIVIANCHLFDTGASGLTIGSETAGGIRKVLVSNCVIEGCRDAIYIRAPRGRGGTVEQIRFTNVIIDRIEEAAVKVSNFFDAIRKDWLKGGARRDLQISRSRPAPIDAGTPTFRDFSFSGLTMGKVRDIAVVEGLPERYVTGVVFQDVTVEEARGGIVLSLAGDVSLSNVALGRPLEAAAVVDAREVERLEVHRLRYPRPLPEAPAVWLENVVGAFVHGCQIGPAGPGYQWLEQAQSRLVELGANAAPALAPAVPALQKG